MEFMGPVKLRVVEESQQTFVAVIRRLEEAGEIQIGRGEEDVLVEAHSAHGRSNKRIGSF